MNVRRKLKNMLGDNELKDYVINYFLQEDNIKQSMEDLQKHGCQSGIVSSLIYYSDTENFYNKYKEEISSLANEIIESTGYNSLFDLIPNLNKEDQLMLESHNKNILAWFGFEETTNKLYDDLFYGREISRDELELWINRQIKPFTLEINIKIW